MGKDIEIYKEKGESPLFVENARRCIELLRKHIDKEITCYTLWQIVILHLKDRKD